MTLDSPYVFGYCLDNAADRNVGGAGDMGGYQNIVVENGVSRVRRFLPEYIQSGSCNTATGQGIFQSIAIYQSSPTNVIGLHDPAVLTVNTIPCAVLGL